MTLKRQSLCFPDKVGLSVFATYFGSPKLGSVVFDTYYDRYLTIEIAESPITWLKDFFQNWALSVFSKYCSLSLCKKSIKSSE